GQVFNGLLSERATRMQNSSVLLASDFALKRVIATHLDPAHFDAATLASAALNYQSRIGVELVWITDESGVLLAVSPGQAHLGQSMAALPTLKEAIETEDAATGIAEIDGVLFHLVAVPVLGPDVIGFLVLGHVVDDALAARLKTDTGADISFLTADRMYASSWMPPLRAQFVPTGDFRVQVLKAPPAARLPPLT